MNVKITRLDETYKRVCCPVPRVGTYTHTIIYRTVIQVATRDFVWEELAKAREERAR